MAAAQNYRTWSDYAGSADSAQYTALTQIDRSNVAKLEVAWTFSTGDGNKYSFNPIVVDDWMYVLARKNTIVALDAASGKERWAHSPGADTTVITHRGMNYWESKDRRERRILFSSNHYLRAIDALTGKPVPTFGDGGKVDLKIGLDRDPATIRLVQSMSPGRVFEDLIILGSATNQGRPAIFALMMCAPGSWRGRSTPCRARASLVTTPGRKTPGSAWAERMCGRS